MKLYAAHNTGKYRLPCINCVEEQQFKWTEYICMISQYIVAVCHVNGAFRCLFAISPPNSLFVCLNAFWIYTNRFYIALVDLRWRKGNPKVHSIYAVLSNYPIMCFIQSCRAIVEKHMFFILRYNIFIRIETVFCIDTIDDSKLPLHGNR